MSETVVSSEMGIREIEPSERTRRIAEIEAVLHQLREKPEDTDAYRAELRNVERKRMELLDPASNEDERQTAA
jgi:uncharacterized protein (DUF58 family)